MQAFLDKQLNFGDIPAVIERVMEGCTGGVDERSRGSAGRRCARPARCARAALAAHRAERPGAAWHELLTLVTGWRSSLPCALLVTVHEFGHYWVARRLGFKVLRFSVGFGRRCGLARRRQRAAPNTCWPRCRSAATSRCSMSVKAPVAEADLPRSFTRRPHWQRIAVLLAGPAFNILFAILLLTGDPAGVRHQRGARAAGQHRCANSPAARAGVRPGDEIIAIEFAAGEIAGRGLRRAVRRRDRQRTADADRCARPTDAQRLARFAFANAAERRALTDPGSAPDRLGLQFPAAARAGRCSARSTAGWPGSAGGPQGRR